jgi:hypothetical protein
VSHIPYTICRSGSYYYNRRVPKHAVSAYGSFIRQSLSQDPVEAELYSRRINEVLESSWSASEVIHPVDVASVIESFKPKSSLLSEMTDEYLSLRSIDQTPVRVALTTFIAVAGDRNIRCYPNVKDAVCQRRSKTAPVAGAIVHHFAGSGRSKTAPLLGCGFVHGPARRSAPTERRSCAGLWSNRSAVSAL